ncbi:MAG: chloride channel protein [Deltaproteobacteria bacterium]|nr:chloride channel protein [Deltaproteobacteria bacterium]
MKQRLKEETIIFASVFKWLILGSVVGVITGVSTTVFVMSLNWGARIAGQAHYYWFLPLGLFLSALIIKYVTPSAQGHGANKVIESIHKHSGKMKPLYAPIEFLRTFITLTGGGCAGKEGPSAQIGAGLASIFADLIRFEGVDRRKLVICGISGAFASVFGTPIAGAVFGIEVLFMGAIRYEVLLPSFVAGVISYQVSTWLGLTYFYHPITFVPVFSELIFIKVAAAGVFFGLASFAFVEILNLCRGVSARIKFPLPVKGLLAGFFLAGITALLGNHYLGLGLDVIQAAIEGKDIPAYAFLMKSFFTGVTLGFGGHGGVGTPIFYVGATAGSAFGHFIGEDGALFAAIGFVSLLAGAANTPIAASIMAVELFGAAVAPYAAISSVISFAVSGHRGAYPSQVIAAKKSSSIEVEIGAELLSAQPRCAYREKSFIGLLRYAAGKFRRAK